MDFHSSQNVAGSSVDTCFLKSHPLHMFIEFILIIFTNTGSLAFAFTTNLCPTFITLVLLTLPAEWWEDVQ